MDTDAPWQSWPAGEAASYAPHAIVLALFLHLCLVARLRALERMHEQTTVRLQEAHATLRRSHERVIDTHARELAKLQQGHITLLGSHNRVAADHTSELAQLQEKHTALQQSQDRIAVTHASELTRHREKLATHQESLTQLDRYTRELLPPPLSTLCANVAGEGDLERLKQLRDPAIYGTRTPWNEDCCTRAAYAKKDRIPLLEWLRDPDTGGGVCPWNESACGHALDDTDVLEWLRDPATGGGVCPWNVTNIVGNSYSRGYATAKKVFDLLTPEERCTAWPADAYHDKMFEDLDFAKLTFGIDGYNHNLSASILYNVLQKTVQFSRGPSDAVWDYIKGKGLPLMTDGHMSYVISTRVPLNRAIDILERLTPHSATCRSSIMRSSNEPLKAWFVSKYGS